MMKAQETRRENLNEYEKEERLVMPRTVKAPLMKQEFPVIDNIATVAKKTEKESTKKVKEIGLKVGKEKENEDEFVTLSGKNLVNTFNLVVQSGHRSLKSFQTQKAAEWKEVPKDVEKEQKSQTIDYEKINEFKQTYRSGFQEKNTSEMVSDQMITMGAKEPSLIKQRPCLGSIAYENGWSGHIKEDIKQKYR